MHGEQPAPAGRTRNPKRGPTPLVATLQFLLAAFALGGATAPTASAGGPFARLIGVSRTGVSIEITLQPSTPAEIADQSMRDRGIHLTA